MDHVFRDFVVREHISKHAISAAEASAESTMNMNESDQRFLMNIPSPRKPKVGTGFKLEELSEYVLEVSCKNTFKESPIN